ncbi:hypothetical protein [Marinicella sp. W31]|uniref:hypothetical protein n=1 Tax=Marinicella sp. W31 TaxID=3023713 RepID=UPI00375716FB
MKKQKRVIVAVGVSARRVKRLSLYLDLLQSQSTDKWMLSDGHQKSDVIFLDANFYSNHLVKNVNPELTICCYDDKNIHSEFTNALRYPFSADQLLKLLNRISHSGKLPSRDEVKGNDSGFLKKMSRMSFFQKKPTPQINNQDVSAPIVSHKPAVVSDIQYKIILMGGPGSGKDVAIKSMAQNNGSSHQSGVEKDVHGNEKLVLNLKHKYGLEIIIPPDEIKNGYSWEATIQSQKIDGFVLLLNLRHFNPVKQLDEYLNLIGDDVVARSAICCALVYYDDTQHSIDKIKRQISDRLGTDTPIVQMDPRKEINVLNVFGQLIMRIN